VIATNSDLEAVLNQVRAVGQAALAGRDVHVSINIRVRRGRLSAKVVLNGRLECLADEISLDVGEEATPPFA